MFESQLDTKHRGSRQLVDDLHNARKLRNRLAHGFLDVGESQYYLTLGGRQSVLERLRRTEEMFFPLILVVNMAGRAYAADLGMTAEYIRKQSECWKAEQKRVEQEIKDVLGEKADDNGGRR
jgi:hypothetical protein